MNETVTKTAYFHLPGLFEFYELYRLFLPMFREHREYFYEWCDIGSIYGAPADCIWGGGRVGFGNANPEDVLGLVNEYGISARLTFSNSLLNETHLSDKKCNKLCKMFEKGGNIHKGSSTQNAGNTENRGNIQNGIIVHSDMLLSYLKSSYPGYYFVSSTTKVQTEFDELIRELNREDFKYVVPDFRFNNNFVILCKLNQNQKAKLEFLSNECCSTYCMDRKKCYENVSRKNLGENCPDHICSSLDGEYGYRFSAAMSKPEFIGIKEITEEYLPMGFSNFKIEGRSLGSAMILEFLLYYMTKPEYQLIVREKIYLNSMLDLF